MKLTELIVELQTKLTEHGDLPVLDGDMETMTYVEVVIGDEVAEPARHPNGFIHIGTW